MNNVTLIGRLTRDPEIRTTQGDNPMTIARYSLAVDRPRTKDGQQQADFINMVEFGKGAEFAEKYFRKGMKIGIVGRIQTGSYTNKDGQKVYTTEVVVNNHEFCESKNSESASTAAPTPATAVSNIEDFAELPDDDEELPFN